MQPNICVITPTIGRPTLERALTSARLQSGDEWIIFADGPQPEAFATYRRLWADMPYLFYIESEQLTGNYGNALRDLAMELSDCDYFLFLDDDDTFTSGAIETVRARMNGGPVIFRMNHPENGVIWKETVVTPGNVGGSMLCLPNDRNRRARWGEFGGHGSDVQFIEKTLTLWPAYEWAGDVIINYGGNQCPI
jgi:glycosyltransferase involved in cell wall biosynthesis